jgi:lipoprotein-anchoring transpeptidase ErfK/SrfK
MKFTGMRTLARVNAFPVCDIEYRRLGLEVTCVGEYQVSAATGRQQASQAENNQFRQAALSNSCWRVAVLTAVGAIGFAARADAAAFWSDYVPAFSQAMPIMPQRARKVRRHSARSAAPARQAAKPQGPLIISISISKQIMKIYDANGLFAETPISTGMRGHSTPMGAFSVIQKQKLHHSNIYSGAPMPYMQRITWSGIAIHAGVLPGYPASHGCIRMPMGFAIKMYGWTRMGARVVVTPGDITPASFSHPLLVTRKLDPQPVVADAPPDKAADADETSKPVILQAKLELRSTVGHPDISRPATIYALSASPSEQTRTADASRAGSTGAAPRMMSDAASGDPGSPQLAEAVATTGTAPSRIADVAAMKPLQTVATKSSEAAVAEDNSAGPATSGVSPNAAEPAKDQSRLADPDKATPPGPELNPLPAPNRTGQISVLVSRKDAKLYVRQNFAPLFDVPISIAASDRPLGTHVFTVEADKNDPTALRWSVISLPTAEQFTKRHNEDERMSRRRKMAGAVDTRPVPLPDSPTEALDRLSIPADAMARIAQGLSTGSSIIVSDQGISAGETGDGTDFIVSLR